MLSPGFFVTLFQLFTFKVMIKVLKKIYRYLEFIENERIKAMIYSGRGWG
jgi:hypothetical protein